MHICVYGHQSGDAGRADYIIIVGVYKCQGESHHIQSRSVVSAHASAERDKTRGSVRGAAAFADVVGAALDVEAGEVEVENEDEDGAEEVEDVDGADEDTVLNPEGLDENVGTPVIVPTVLVAVTLGGPALATLLGTGRALVSDPTGAANEPLIPASLRSLQHPTHTRPRKGGAREMGREGLVRARRVREREGRECDVVRVRVRARVRLRLHTHAVSQSPPGACEAGCAR
jgi:hypothetical protein